MYEKTGSRAPSKEDKQSREGAPPSGSVPAEEEGSGPTGERRVKSEQQSRPNAAGTSFGGENQGNKPQDTRKAKSAPST